MAEGYQLQYDEQGRPFFQLPGKPRNYVSPVAMGGSLGPDGSGFLHTDNQWNSKTGKVENPFNWNKFITMATAGGLGAGALDAALAGGAGAASGVGAAGGSAEAAGNLGADVAGAGADGATDTIDGPGIGNLLSGAGGGGLAKSGMDLFTKLLLGGTLGTSVLGALFNRPKSFEGSTGTGTGPGAKLRSLDPHTLMATGLDNLDNAYSGITDYINSPVNLPGAYAQQPPTFSGGGLPSPIGVNGQDPAIKDPSMTTMPGVNLRGPAGANASATPGGDAQQAMAALQLLQGANGKPA